MAIRMLSSLALFAFSAPALAAADITTSITLPSTNPTVYATGHYEVTVSNIGNKSASNVALTIQLPETNTSPQVYVMGNLVARSSSCTTSGTKLSCALGTVAKSTSRTVSFDIQFPESADPLVISASATTTSSENSTSNNSDTETASLTYVDVTLSGDQAVNNNHCTGTGLAAYFECTKFPSSISNHHTILNADNTITVLDDPSYTGVWSQPNSYTLEFTYYDPDGFEAGSFSGRGVDGTCWEGLTTFPGSSYVAPYEVCFE